LQRFHVGIWSKMPIQELRPIFLYLFPQNIILKVSFIFGREYCVNNEKFPWCYKMLTILFSKKQSMEVFMEDQVLMVNISPLSICKTLDHVCYICFPFVKELLFSNSSCVILYISIDIILFIYPLANYKFVSNYLKSSPRLDQFHYEVAKSIEYVQFDWHGIL